MMKELNLDFSNPDAQLQVFFMISQNNPPKEMPQSTFNKLKSLLVLHCLFHTKIILLNDTLSELSKNSNPDEGNLKSLLNVTPAYEIDKLFNYNAANSFECEQHQVALQYMLVELFGLKHVMRTSQSAELDKIFCPSHFNKKIYMSCFR